MSLGVLNNLNAMYAANNLNNTSNSLSTVLQQLSSGSKINSGADDAAGLSLVNGLQANSVALAQSKTNAQEGVGLLTVADGALSQVTNLLNRAVTLATEASNGTLNSSQDTAANNEYQSILAEISNIGSTTTYNGQTVFGSKVNIYTGDSSTQGASINSLNIASLSSSNVGDSGGVMAYSNGKSGVFLNLSTGSKNAQSTDTLNASQTSTINVNYMVKGANGASNPAATSITVGGASGYANTANGLISAINSSGLGLTASFTTQSQAGIGGGGTQTGIQISGGLISVGVDASTASTSGTLNASGITDSNLTLGQTISVTVGGAAAASVAIDKSNNTLAALAHAINFNDTLNPTVQNSKVTATVVVDNTGKSSLQLADASSTGGELKATSTAGNVVPNILTPGTVVASTSDPVAVNFTAGVAGQAGGVGTAKLSIGGAGSNDPTQALTGSIALSNGGAAQTFIMGAGATDDTSVANQITLSAGHSTLGGLATAIAAKLGATATVSSTGIAIASVGTGTQITEAAGSTLSAALSVGQQSNVAGIAATSGTDGQTTLSMTGDPNGFKSDGSDVLTTGKTLTLQNGSGSLYTFTMGSSVAGSGTVTETTGALTTGSLLTAINSTTATSGLSATISNGKIVVNSSTVNTTIAAVSTLTGTSAMFTNTAVPVNPTLLAQSFVNVTAAIGAPAAGQGSLTQTGTTLTGDITVNNGGTAFKVLMGTGGSDVAAAGQITLSAANSTMSGVMAAINAQTGTTNVVASLDQTATGSGLTLTANNGAAAAIAVTNNLTAANTLSFTTPTLGGGGQAQSALLSLTNAGVLAQGGSVAQDGTISGSISITTTTGNKTVTDTFNMGNATASTAGTSTTNGTYNVAGGKLSDLLAAINTAGGDNLNMTAVQDSGTGGIFMQAKNTVDTGLVASSNNLSTTMALSKSAITGATYTPASVNVTNGGVNSASDLLTEGTSVVLTNSATGIATTFTMGGVTATGTVGVGTAGVGSSQSMLALANAISGAGLNLSATVGSTGLTITSTAANGAGTITVGANTLTDAFKTGAPVATAGTGATAATNAVATINTSKGMATDGSDPLAGQIKLTNSSNGTEVTFKTGGTAGVASNVVTLGAATSTLNDLVMAINANATLGMTASINSSTGALQVQSNATNTAITVAGNSLTDATSEAFTNSAAGAQSVYSTGSFALGGTGNTFAAGNQLTGSIAITVGATTKTFVMGGTAGTSTDGKTITLGGGTSSVGDLESKISSALGVNASLSTDGTSMKLQNLTAADNSTISVVSTNFKDTMGAAPATATLGTYASASDKLTGTLAIKVGNTDTGSFSVAGMSVTEVMNKINTGSTDGTGTTPDSMGVHASLVADSSGFQTLTLTSDTYGAAGNITNGSTGTLITDAAQTATLSYTQGSAYNIGISNGANGVYDSSTQAGPGVGASAAFANLSSSSGSSSGVATISYSDGAGVSLSATDLTNQADAQISLKALNAAITAVAAQDGYIGAQINTLNAVSSVLSTQQQNVVAAQNAVQATDYATAASNMSKYQILSQTGISALAQANSMQQEVTKLLQ